MPYTHLIVYKEEKRQIAHLQINRPEVRNALNPELMEELSTALQLLDQDKDVKAMVISGSEKSFAAGADIKAMSDKGAMEMYQIDQFALWDEIPKLKKPLIAAVSGYALGGGCELAMMCDIVIASETATFGQPEIKLGVIPGAGGTQRLTHALGKSRAMELILTGDSMDVKEAFHFGLVSKVYPVEEYLEKALELAAQMAVLPSLAIQLAKESILNTYENSLKEGLRLERKNFYLLFDTKDQKEGMAAFLEKREAKFQGE